MQRMKNAIKYTIMALAASRQIIGGGAPIFKYRRRRRLQIDGGGGAARPAQGDSL